jgi:hypothetical protein
MFRWFYEVVSLMAFVSGGRLRRPCRVGALTVEFAAEVKRLRAQHVDAVQEKSAAESKSRRLTEKLAAMEAEKGELRHQLVEERREANKAIVDA